jgi:hypothetical protein
LAGFKRSRSGSLAGGNFGGSSSGGADDGGSLGDAVATFFSPRAANISHELAITSRARLAPGSLKLWASLRHFSALRRYRSTRSVTHTVPAASKVVWQNSIVSFVPCRQRRASLQTRRRDVGFLTDRAMSVLRSLFRLCPPAASCRRGPSRRQDVCFVVRVHSGRQLHGLFSGATATLRSALF